MNSCGGLRPEWNHRARQLLGCRGIWAVALLVVVVQLLLVVFHGSEWRVYECFGLSRAGVMRGDIWQLLTHGLLHGGWLHLLLNVSLLVMVGSRIEHVCGARDFARLIFLGVLAGGLAHLATSPDVLVGISGGVMALILCYCSLSPESRIMMPFKVSAKSMGRGLVCAETLLMLMDPRYRIPGFAAAGNLLAGSGLGGLFEISHGCHLGGAAAGWLYARWLLRPRVTREMLLRDRARRERGG